MKKAQVLVGCKCIDENFEALFIVYLPQNPHSQCKTVIPCHPDKIPTSDSIRTYADALLQSTSSLPSQHLSQ